MPDSPFAKAVIMSVPLFAAFRPLGRAPDQVRLAAQLPRQAAAQLVHRLLPIALASRTFRVSSWCRLCGGSGRPATTSQDDDIPLVEAAIGTPENWRAALAMYRANFRGTKPPAEYADLHRLLLEPPTVPTLYLHGDDDGCVAPDYIPWVERVLPEGSDAFVVEGAGHFLQLEQPEVVAQHIIDFIGRA